MHAQTIALSVQDLSKKYDSRFAVSHANFEVPLGSICGFVGPNGAGKTTTIRMLAWIDLTNRWHWTDLGSFN